jgi:hypothetical protein
MKPAATLATLLLGVVAIAHLLRLVLGIQVVAAGNVIPLWVSAPGCLVPAAIAVALWRESRAS